MSYGDNMISIIIPVLNEEKTIGTALERLSQLNGNKELIVVDGGSSDRTKEIAADYAAVYASCPGRAKQMNLGARHAKGDILWFVHSDSIVSRSSLEDIESSVEHGHIGGGFRLYFHDWDTIFMRFVSTTSNLRAGCLGLYFGDQGIFMRRDIFQRLKGFPEIPIMEDWELSLRLKKLGKMEMVKSGIGTSARRFKNGGAFRTLMLMHRIKLLHMLGLSPERLVKLYRDKETFR